MRKEEIKLESTHLVEYMDDKYPFYLDPMPNLYFTRDPQASVGRGMTVNRMFGEQDVENPSSFHIF